jgi:hypothetical protein
VQALQVGVVVQACRCAGSCVRTLARGTVCNAGEGSTG